MVYRWASLEATLQVTAALQMAQGKKRATLISNVQSAALAGQIQSYTAVLAVNLVRGWPIPTSICAALGSGQ